MKEILHVLGQVVDAVSEAACLIDSDGKILRANRGFDELFGEHGSGNRQSSFSALLEQDGPSAATELLFALERDGAFSTVISIGDDKGVVRPFRVNGRRIDGSRPALFFTSLRPEWAVGRNAALSEHEPDTCCGRKPEKNELDLLLGSIAHDFTNLLGAIKINCQFAKMQAENDESVLDELSLIESSSKRALLLADQLVTVGRGQEIRPQKIRLGELLQEMADGFEELLGDQSTLELDIDGVPGVVYVDPDRTEEVISNLVKSARETLPKRGGHVRMRVRNVGPVYKSVKDFNGISYGPGVLLSISDDGEGIAPDRLKELFTPFGWNKTKRMTGLELTVVERIVTQSGGRVEVDSRLGEGTEFRVWFPFAE